MFRVHFSACFISVLFSFSLIRFIMARGQQKIQSQQKAAKKAQDMKRQQGHDQKAAAQKALVHQCCVCKVSYIYI